MLIKIVRKCIDQLFGPEGFYAWPSNLSVAMGFIEVAPSTKSSADCLDEDFFYEVLGYKHNLEELLDSDEALENAKALAEAEAYTQQQLFQHARSWPLPFLVPSAGDNILSINPENIHMISDVWPDFLWLFLLFDKPLFDTLRGKGWNKLYKNTFREGFKWQRQFEIDGLTNNRLIWSSDKDKPCIIYDAWFIHKTFTPRIYPEDVFRCLDLVGIDRDLAQSAVDKVFNLQSLTPLYNVLQA